MKTAKKYLAFLQISMAESLRLSPSLLGKIIFYILITYIMSRIWTVTAISPNHLGMSAADLIWYVTLTEWVLISTPMVHTEIEKDIQSGDIAYSLCRPVSYIWTHVARGFGTFLLHALILGVCGLLFASYLTGQFLNHPASLVWGVPMAVLAGFLWIVFQVSIGVSAFWLFDASPFYWLWQKSAFVLGGLILPLSIYPIWFRTIAEWTPFSSILYGPAQAMVTGDANMGLRVVSLLLVWSLLAMVLMHSLFRIGVKKIDVSGG
jgi:ABC-2 type transport system permease protein